MNKRLYHHPAIEVMSIDEGEPLLAASGREASKYLDIDIDDASADDIGQARSFLDL